VVPLDGLPRFLAQGVVRSKYKDDFYHRTMIDSLCCHLKDGRTGLLEILVVPPVRGGVRHECQSNLDDYRQQLKQGCGILARKKVGTTVEAIMLDRSEASKYLESGQMNSRRRTTFGRPV